MIPQRKWDQLLKHIHTGTATDLTTELLPETHDPLLPYSTDMKLQPLSPMIGFQCSPSVQPVYGRSGLYSSSGHQVVAPAPQNAFHRPPILPPNILDYWPGLGNDGLHVSWAHAVNSRSKLNDALIGESLEKVFLRMHVPFFFSCVVPVTLTPVFTGYRGKRVCQESVVCGSWGYIQEVKSSHTHSTLKQPVRVGIMLHCFGHSPLFFHFCRFSSLHSLWTPYTLIAVPSCPLVWAT